jgi:hypothetical protein
MHPASEQHLLTNDRDLRIVDKMKKEDQGRVDRTLITQWALNDSLDKKIASVEFLR